MGPGIALEYAAKRATEGRVVGVDHSELMVKVACRHNAEAIRNGRVEVLHGTAQTALERGMRFDRVFAVNVIQFWDSPQNTLRALRDVMTPGSTMAMWVSSLLPVDVIFSRFSRAGSIPGPTSTEPATVAI